VREIVNDKIEKDVEVDMTYFTVLSQELVEVTQENPQQLSRELRPRSPEHEAGVLTMQ
jgi:hypothetical protein